MASDTIKVGKPFIMLYNPEIMLYRGLMTFLIVSCLTLPVLAEEINLPFQKNPAQNIIESPVMMIDSQANSTVILKIKASRPELARLYWVTSYDQRFDQLKSIWFSIKPGENNYYFNVASQNPYWIGWVRKLLVIPDGQGDYTVTGGTAGPGNLLTTIASGWQEFWGPKGRVQTGFSINVTHSSPIFNTSINVYCYWLIGLVFAWALLANLIRLKPRKLTELERPFLRATKAAFIAILAAWILLTINSDYNFANLFKINYQKYYGKSLEQKHAEAYGQDYYAFLKFAAQKLPKTPVYFALYSSIPSSDLAARLFLVPHVYAGDTSRKPDYLLVFFPTPDQLKQLQGLPVFARLDNNKYIVKGKK